MTETVKNLNEKVQELKDELEITVVQSQSPVTPQLAQSFADELDKDVTPQLLKEIEEHKQINEKLKEEVPLLDLFSKYPDIQIEKRIG